MGCFNVACNLTQISMYSDKALWVPLVSSDENGKIGQGDSYYIYPICQFTPIAAPVFGNLDSYGRLENIERTPNVEAIERYFGCDIYELIDNPGDYSIRKIKGDKTVSGTFFHRGAFEHVSKYLYDDGGGNIANLTTNDMTDAILNICGFFNTGKKSSHERYNQIYVSERYPGVEWCSDGTWGSFSDKHESIFNPIAFLASLEKQTGISPDPDVLKALNEQNSFKLSVQSAYKQHRSQVDFWQKMEALATKLESKFDIEKPKKDFDLATYEMSQFYRGIAGMGEGARFDAPKVLRDIYGDNPEPYLDDLANLKLLSCALSVSNRFWSPQCNGYQHGSNFQEMNLAKFIYEFNKNEIEGRNREHADLYKDNPDMMEEECIRIPVELEIA